ncbi:MAG TPA: hypothetical protein PLZ36_06085, partial [Armatimonadota bacterium]|nr:hypothetical protein [Armatimonadota bacterium]
MTRIALSLLLVLSLAAVAADLPVTDVVLYSSGVGYLQRTGSVTGHDLVTLSFKAEQINDLLKSLVLIDLDGGKVGAITYGAQDPISKTLSTYAIDLTDNPSIAVLLIRLRGVTVTVTATNAITGKVLGVETKTRYIKEGEVVETEVLNLVTPTGIRSVRLEEISDIAIADERLNTELRDALDVLASGL